jgi:hypothetical protein
MFRRWLCAVMPALVGAVRPVLAQGNPSVADAPGPAALSGFRGVAVDSIHGGPLVGAVVSVLQTKRRATTDEHGRFRIDSVPAGTYRLALSHAILDTLGLDLPTNPIELPRDRYVDIILATPSGRALRRVFCEETDTVATPSLVMGRVKDADTDAPVAGARVSLVFDKINASQTVGVHRVQLVRSATTRSDGTYVICGLANDTRGTLRADHAGMTTAEVEVALNNDVIALRSLSTGSPPAAASEGARQGGQAALRGVVLDSLGRPVAGAMVMVTETAASTLSGSNGEFSLVGLPSGTRELTVRHLGFAPSSLPVELTVRAPKVVTVHLSMVGPMLPRVVIATRADSGLSRVGFTERKRSSMGYFIMPSDVTRIRPEIATDLLATVPGLRVSESSNGLKVITPARAGGTFGGSCVNVFVDRAPMTFLRPGELDTAVPVADIAAIESYSAESVPMEFEVPGKSCATVVIWTHTKVGDH